MDVVFSGETAPEFVRWLGSAPHRRRPHLLILDLLAERQADVTSALIRHLLALHLRIVILSALASPPLVRGALRAGVAVVVSKRDPEHAILSACRAALRGEEWMSAEAAAAIALDHDSPGLSIQEERALVLYASGLTLDQVGQAMNIRRDTVKQYLNRTRKKYAATGVTLKSQLDFGRLAWREGRIDP